MAFLPPLRALTSASSAREPVSLHWASNSFLSFSRAMASSCSHLSSSARRAGAGHGPREGQEAVGGPVQGHRLPCYEAEVNALKGGRKAMIKMETRIRELESELDAES